jgi:adenine deaminase
MEDLTKLTPTELLVKGNQIKAKHDALKDEIIASTHEIEKLQNEMNEKALELQSLEENYVKIVEIIENQNGI